jgi:hypothetical protein
MLVSEKAVGWYGAGCRGGTLVEGVLVCRPGEGVEEDKLVGDTAVWPTEASMP